MEPLFKTKKDCPICVHPEREKIEAVLYRVTPDNAEEVLQKLSDAYDIDVEAFETHAMFHASLDLTPAGEQTSIVRQLKLREIDMLAQCAKDYADTMSLLGARIRAKARNASDKDGLDDMRFERSMTKPFVELYLGCGDNVRKTVKDIADINQILNGPKDDGLSGLGALAAAIHKSMNPDVKGRTIFDLEDGEGES